jgi:hypothetical protein
MRFSGGVRAWCRYFALSQPCVPVHPALPAFAWEVIGAQRVSAPFARYWGAPSLGLRAPSAYR